AVRDPFGGAAHDAGDEHDGWRAYRQHDFCDHLMAGTPLQSPFVSLVQRIALFQSFTISAGSSSAAKIITGTFQGAGSAALIPLQGQQAFRIRSLDLGLSDFAQTGNLT